MKKRTDVLHRSCRKEHLYAKKKLYERGKNGQKNGPRYGNEMIGVLGHDSAV